MPKMPNPKILVTGATGTTGGEVVRQLAAAGIPARALVRNLAKVDSSAYQSIEFVAGDLGDPASLAHAMKGVDALYLNVVPGPDALVHIDNSISAAKDAGISTIVKLSGLYASANSSSEIIRMHSEADDRVCASELGYTILRANSFYQNILGQLEGIKTNGTFYLPLGDAHQSLIDVVDIAAIAILAMTTEAYRNKTYDLTGPESLTFADVAESLSRARGKPVTYMPITRAQFEETLRGYGTPPSAANDVGELFDVFASGIYADVTSDAQTILGRAPRSFATFAKPLFN
jgi:uncharacterized protein YbjT (DUF2867 family)